VEDFEDKEITVFECFEPFVYATWRGQFIFPFCGFTTAFLANIG
jgi:hypothetical protein